MAKNDSTLLRMQVDVGKAYDLLTMFKEAGKNRIDIQTILDDRLASHADGMATAAGITRSPSRLRAYYASSALLVSAGYAAKTQEDVEPYISKVESYLEKIKKIIYGL